MKIIGFVGLPGSGKSVASNVARDMGIEVLVMGDVIRQEAARLGLEPKSGSNWEPTSSKRRSCRSSSKDNGERYSYWKGYDSNRWPAL
ncbi:MAG: AAA family ATPase [Methanothrix sp.]|nr:AAA family ATPase [Methanothrix sp.]